MHSTLILLQFLLALATAQVVSFAVFSITHPPQLALPVATSVPRPPHQALALQDRDTCAYPNYLCGSSCIDSQIYFCCSDGDFQCPQGNTYCGSGQCCMDTGCFFSYGTDKVVTTITSTTQVVFTEYVQTCSLAVSYPPLTE